MKRLFVIFSCGGLLLLFFVYSGFFRDNRNPVSVVKFYYQCMKNWEWFLTVPAYSQETFNYAKEEADYRQKRLFLLRDVAFRVLNQDQQRAEVAVVISYKDGHQLRGVIGLSNERGRWLINTISYE